MIEQFVFVVEFSIDGESIRKVFYNPNHAVKYAEELDWNCVIHTERRSICKLHQ